MTVCLVLNFLPVNVLATEEEPVSSAVVLVSPSSDISALHFAYSDGDSELTGIADMLALFTDNSRLTAYDQSGNPYTIPVTWAYYGYQCADGTLCINQGTSDFAPEKGSTYYFMPVLDESAAAQYSFQDITQFLARVDYFLDSGSGDAPAALKPTAMPALTLDLSSDALTITNDTYPGAGPHSVNLSNTIYSLTLDLDPTGFTGTPKLVVSIPKGITLSSYPTASNATLSDYIQSVNAQPEADGSTTLAYTFNTGISTLGFNITLLPTYKLKTGQTCTVTAAVYDDETQMDTASDAITIASNPTLALGAYYIPNYDTADQNIDLKTADYYYAKAYGRFYYSYPNNHYDYDSLTVTVPIPDNATPGYYNSENTFVALSPDEPYAFTNGTATYKTNLTFSTDGGFTYGAAGSRHGLVYELAASHAMTVFANYQVYSMYDSVMGGIWFRFPGDTTAGTYTPGCSPKIVAEAGGDRYTLLEHNGYDGLSSSTLSYSFRNYNINDYIYPGMSYGCTTVYTEYYVMPIRDNQFFYSYLYNLSGESLKDVQVEYTGSDASPLPSDIHCYKLLFNLSSSNPNPSTADVTYSYYDASTGEVKTDGHAFMTASDPVLALDDGDYFTKIRATYDRLGASSSPITPLQRAFCYNADNINTGSCSVYSKILSATMGEQTYSSSTWSKTGSTVLYPRTTLPVTPYYMYLSGTSNGLDKGTRYSFNFMPSYYGTVNNLCTYFLLPAGYEFQSYAAPASWGVTGSAYTITSRPITVDTETNIGTYGMTYKVPAGTYTLYKIQYNDGIDHIAMEQHSVYFSLGPTVNTAEVKTGLTIPSVLCMSTENTAFPFFIDNGYYSFKDLLDFDNDGDTSEMFARFNAPPTATQNAAKVITLSGSLTSSYESGSGTSKSYQYNSAGTYTFTVYNGLDSGNTATNATVNITVPSTGTGIFAKPTGAPTLHGDFLTGATVSYSTDGGTTYLSAVEDWSTVTNVKVVTASGHSLASSEAAYVSVPFKANYGESASPASTGTFTASMSYSLYKDGSLVSTPNSSAQDCSMITAPVQAGGRVFKDYDGDGIQDTNEMNNGKSYNVYLYSGAYTSGTDGLTYLAYGSTTDAGAFNFADSIYKPGEYTLHISLSGTELLNTNCEGWVRNGDDVYYTFTVGDSVNGVTASLPLTAPRTLILNYTSCFLYDNAAKKLTATVLPALEDGESISYVSSNPDIVAVSSGGTMTYVSDGTADIIVTVPGYGEDSSNITAHCTVYARKGSYSLTLHPGTGITLNAAGYTGSSGIYTGSYTPGSYISLPSSSALTNSDPTYYFGGWYDNADFTGPAIYSITDTDYGNKAYYAKWTRYETAYETAPGSWAYGALWTAFSSVYDGGEIQLLSNVSLDSVPNVSKNITLKTDGNARTLTLNYYIYVSGGSLTIDDANLNITGSSYYLFYVYNTGTLNVSAGTITGTNSYPIFNQTGTVNISGGSLSATEGAYAAIYNATGNVNISGGTVSGTGVYTHAIYNNTGVVNISGGSVSSTNNYGVVNSGAGSVYLSGTPIVSGHSADLFESYKGTVFGRSDASTPVYYSGSTINVDCGWSPVAIGDVVVSGVSGTGRFTALNTGSYTAKLSSGSLIVAKYDYSGTETTAPVAADRTTSSITLQTQTISGQTVEYACSTADAVPASGWQTSTAFTGLDEGTIYYFFARVKETDYVDAGAASSAAITTQTLLSSAVSMADYSYGGTVPTPSVSSNPGGGTVTYYYNTENTNADGTEWVGITPATLSIGTYYMYAVIAETDGYTGCTTAAKKFTVSRGDVSVSVNMTDYTYGDVVPTPYVSAYPGGGTVTYYYNQSNSSSGGIAWAGISPTTLDAGTYYMYAVIEEAANYNGVTTAASAFKVLPKSVPVIWSGSAASYTYNATDQGNAITAKYVDVDGNDIDLAIQFTHNSQTATFINAGIYTATALLTPADGNYTLTNATKTVAMAQAPVTVTAADKTITYGDAAANAGYTITNGTGSALFGSDAFTGTPQYTYGSYASGSNTGSYPIVVSGLINPNYNVTFKAGTLTVKAATITDTTAAEQSAVYTGRPLTLSTPPAGATVNNQRLTVKFSPDSGKTYTLDAAPSFMTAGKYTVYYQMAAPNHVPVTGAVAFTVTQNLSNAISGLACGNTSYGKTPAPSISDADFGANAVTYSFSDSKNGKYTAWNPENPAGTWWVKATIPGTANYTGATAYTSFTVEKAAVNTPTPANLFYTGLAQKADIPKSPLYTVKDNTGGTNAGTYSVTLTLTDPVNYRWNGTDSTDVKLSYRIQKAVANAINGMLCGDVAYGAKPGPSISGAAYGADTVTYVYAASKNGAYGPWSTENVPGNYWVKAIVPATENYAEASSVIRFTYLPKASDEKTDAGTVGITEKLGAIGVNIANKSSDNLSVIVSVQRGSSEIAFKSLTITAGTSGSVEYKDLPAAFYNVVVTTGAYKDTRMLEVTAEKQSKVSFTIEDLNHRTVVEVQEKTPDVAVDNLYSVFKNPVTNDHSGITQDDLDSGQPIEIMLKAERIEFVDETEKSGLEQLNGNRTIGLYIDLSLFKTVGENTTRLTSVNELLEVAIPIPDEMRQYESTIVVYRIHEGEPQMITTKPNGDGEYLEINGDYVILHVKSFSTYALGYSVPGFPWWLLLLLLIPITFGVYYYKKRKDRLSVVSFASEEEI